MEFLEALRQHEGLKHLSDSEFSIQFPLLQNEFQKTQVGRAFVAMNIEAARSGISDNPKALLSYAADCLSTDTDAGVLKGIHALGFALSLGCGENENLACGMLSRIYIEAQTHADTVIAELVKVWGDHLARFHKINILEGMF